MTYFLYHLSDSDPTDPPDWLIDPDHPAYAQGVVEALRRELWDNGFRPVPVYNHDLTWMHGSEGKQPKGAGWQDAARQNPPRTVLNLASHDALNTGILCDGLRAVDIDIKGEGDGELAERVYDIVVRHLGAAPYRVRAGSTSRLYLYRAAVGEPRKRNINDGVSGGRAIEILGFGQQFVAFGTHKSGAELVWPHGSPLTHSVADLPGVTEDQVEAMLDEIAPLIGADVAKLAADRARDAGPLLPQTHFEGDVPLEDVASAVAAMPADDGHDTWLKGMAAIYNTTGGSMDGLALAHDYSRKGVYDNKAVDRQWRTFHSGPLSQIGVGTLFHMARQGDPDWVRPSSQQRPQRQDDALAEVIRAKRAASAAKAVRVEDAEHDGDDYPDDVGEDQPPMVAAVSNSVVHQTGPYADLNTMIASYNSRFALVQLGGSVKVCHAQYNAEIRRDTVVEMTPDAFRLMYGNEYVKVSRQNEDGEFVDVKRSAVAEWLRHPMRRTCPEGYCLDPTGRASPGSYNLWRGFGVEERQGDWSKLNAMIRDVLAAGNDEHHRYILQWLAHLVQHPAENPGVALVFRGEEGTGKGTLGKAITRMMGAHAIHIAASKFLTGPFNNHLRDVLFLFADEAFFAGDKANEGALKALITEEFRVNEAKGRDATFGRNHCHIMMASNNDWVVPASAEARRFAVFEVSSIYRQNMDYFGAILDEMDVDGDAAGVSAMLYDLKRMKVDKSFVRKAPETTGLQAQRVSTLKGCRKWFLDVLERGYVSPTPGTWAEDVTSDDLYHDYIEFFKRMGDSYPDDRRVVGKMLSGMFTKNRRSATSRDPNRPWQYHLGPLADARAAFSTIHKVGSNWSEEAGED